MVVRHILTPDEPRTVEHLQNVESDVFLEIFHYLDGLYQKALDVTDDDITQRYLCWGKAERKERMVAAELDYRS